jgi:hypothetical protein
MKLILSFLSLAYLILFFSCTKETTTEEDNTSNISEIPTIEENSSCESCKLIQKAWNKYYTILDSVINYADYGKIPDAPQKGKYTCKNCKNVEKQCEDYANKVKTEMEHAIKNKYYPVVGLPDFKKVDHCPDCLKIYEEWTLYTFCLMGITNYAAC